MDMLCFRGVFARLRKRCAFAVSMLGYAVLARCFCSVAQTLRLRGVCVWLCCAFVAVFVFGYAVFSWCICWGMLRFRRVFWFYGYVLISIRDSFGDWHVACIKEHARNPARMGFKRSHSHTQCHASVYRIHHSHTPMQSPPSCSACIAHSLRF